jgi:Ca2+-binding EF-hand superfamily protein
VGRWLKSEATDFLLFKFSLFPYVAPHGVLTGLGPIHGTAAVIPVFGRDKEETRSIAMFARLALSLGLLFGVGVFALSLPAAAKTKVDAALMKTLDPDNDGTVDLAEAKAAGAAAFKKLDPDNDGTLDAKELKGRLDASAIKAADPDKDGTIDLTEYNAVIEADFKAADPDNDGTLDKKELESKKGQKLLNLIA